MYHHNSHIEGACQDVPTPYSIMVAMGMMCEHMNYSSTDNNEFNDIGLHRVSDMDRATLCGEDLQCYLEVLEVSLNSMRDQSVSEAGATDDEALVNLEFDIETRSTLTNAIFRMNELLDNADKGYLRDANANEEVMTYGRVAELLTRYQGCCAKIKFEVSEITILNLLKEICVFLDGIETSLKTSAASDKGMGRRFIGYLTTYRGIPENHEIQIFAKQVLRAANELNEELDGLEIPSLKCKEIMDANEKMTHAKIAGFVAHYRANCAGISLVLPCLDPWNQEDKQTIATTGAMYDDTFDMSSVSRNTIVEALGELKSLTEQFSEFMTNSGPENWRFNNPWAIKRFMHQMKVSNKALNKALQCSAMARFKLVEVPVPGAMLDFDSAEAYVEAVEQHCSRLSLELTNQSPYDCVSSETMSNSRTTIGMGSQYLKDWYQDSKNDPGVTDSEC